MLTPAATAARIASEAGVEERAVAEVLEEVRLSVNGAMPIHCAPSPPICVMPVIVPCPPG